MVAKQSWEVLKKWLMIIGIIGLVVLGIWYLVQMNSGDADDQGEKVREGKKGAITSGLIDGKDYGTDYTLDEEAEFEALVVLRDQSGEDGLKRGDVLAVRKLPHLWSDTETKSYLVVKIRMKGKDALALTEPKKEGESVVLARAKRIDLDAVGFTGTQVVSGQPLGDKVFDTDIIRKK